MTSSRPPTSTQVATALAPSDSLIPRAFNAATTARNTMTTNGTGASSRAPRYSPANPSAKAPTDTMPAANMQNPTTNPANGPKARVA